MPERDTSQASDERSEAAEVLGELLAHERVRFLRLAATLVEGQPIDPEDVVQGACISFLVSYSPRAGYENPAGYLCAAIKTTAWKLRRSRGRKQARDWPLDASSEAADIPAGEELDVDELERVRRELAALPERERQAVGLRLLGFTSAECAGAIGATSRSYRKVIGRANERLRQSLGD